MTIDLPYPTPQGENLADSDAGNGAVPGPTGSPEGMDANLVTDTLRYNKTCIKQNTENIEAINAALGTMAEQDASNVNITGGTIDAAVSVAEAVNATQLGGLTLQAIYDAMLPVGFVQMRSAFSLPVAPAGVSATWAILTGSDGRVIRMTEASPPLTTGGTDVRTTSGTSLTTAQMPTHNHNQISGESTPVSDLPGPNDAIARELTGSGDASYRLTRSTLAVTQGVTSDTGNGDPHDHTVTVLPRYMELAAYVRTA